jgi:uncharacterized membrane protein
MNATLMKAAGIAAIFIGEFLAIYTEMGAARAAKTAGVAWWAGAAFFLWMTLAGALLLAGYFLSYLSLRNMWVVMVISIGAILIVEPLLIMLIFKEAPTVGAWVGLGLAVLGIASSMLF